MADTVGQTREFRSPPLSLSLPEMGLRNSIGGHYKLYSSICLYADKSPERFGRQAVPVIDFCNPVG